MLLWYLIGFGASDVWPPCFSFHCSVDKLCRLYLGGNCYFIYFFHPRTKISVLSVFGRALLPRHVFSYRKLFWKSEFCLRTLPMKFLSCLQFLRLQRFEKFWPDFWIVKKSAEFCVLNFWKFVIKFFWPFDSMIWKKPVKLSTKLFDTDVWFFNSQKVRHSIFFLTDRKFFQFSIPCHKILKGLRDPERPNWRQLSLLWWGLKTPRQNPKCVTEGY